MCKIIFSSNNQLHQHVCSTHEKFKIKQSVSKILSSDSESKTILNYVDVYITEIVKSDTVNVINKVVRKVRR